MNKITKIMYGLDQCLMDSSTDEYEEQCVHCPYYDPEVSVGMCRKDLLDDVTSILILHRQKPIKHIDASNWRGNCPSCGETIHRYSNCHDNYFCGHCGQAIKWDD